MQTLNRSDVQRIVGDVDDIVAARLIATGISEEELVRAVGEVLAGDEMGEAVPPESVARVERARAILAELHELEVESDFESSARAEW